MFNIKEYNDEIVYQYYANKIKYADVKEQAILTMQLQLYILKNKCV